ncbi:MAG: isoaspartyl peptidase/L-asparaginase [Actinomycetota bacterium]|nr:isoaspartyl peptidase/L-asparaginase [Actinomycetota bacterium]
MRLFVHGGVSGRPKPPRSLTYAVAAGAAQPTALDAVEAAVVAMEDDPDLNSGFGSAPNRGGAVEMDAGIADGSSGRAAGVACVNVRNPIVLARKVLEETPHVLLVGSGAAALAEASGIEFLDTTSDEQLRRWEAARAAGKLESGHYGTAEHVDTVGAIALDDSGRLAAASSTGGVFGQLPGRVGDAPIFGAGIYASTRVAVVGTGVGEAFLQTLACGRVAQLVEDGVDLAVACAKTIGFIDEHFPGSAAGLLALDSDGYASAMFNGGSWVVEGPGGTFEATQLG